MWPPSVNIFKKFTEALSHFTRGYEWGSAKFGRDDELVKKLRKCMTIDLSQMSIGMKLKKNSPYLMKI